MAEERIGKITKISDETTKNGKAYKKIAFECEGRGQVHSLFLPSLVKIAKENAGKWVKITGEENEDGYWNVSAIEKVEAPEGVPSNGDKMTKKDWDAKDRHIVRQACIKAAVRLVAVNDPQMSSSVYSDATTSIEIAKQFEAYVYSEDMPQAKKPEKAREKPTKDLTPGQRLTEQAVKLGWDPDTEEGKNSFNEWFEGAANGLSWDELTTEGKARVIKLLTSKADKEGKVASPELPF